MFSLFSFQKLSPRDVQTIVSSRELLSDIRESLSDIDNQIHADGGDEQMSKRLRRLCLQLSVIEGGLDAFMDDYGVDEANIKANGLTRFYLEHEAGVVDDLPSSDSAEPGSVDAASIGLSADAVCSDEMADALFADECCVPV